MTRRALPCPRCPRGVVSVTVLSWADARSRGGYRRSAWADEPACCTAGCRLSTAQLVPLLRRAYGAEVWQAPLWEEAAG